ncbi:BF2992 family fimbrillin-A clan protein [Patescibacteria group bacterium]|nr:BF2992 family fimbrillin-A clan protein [Patescibacteria group bacterium]
MSDKQVLSQDQKQQLSIIKKSLNLAEKSVEEARKIVDSLLEGKDVASVVKSTSKEIRQKARKLSTTDGGKIVEGVFDGQNMIGPDSRLYPMPANYASKSKLVEGDVLKLTIQDDGTFLFKQIGPIERSKVIGKVVEDNGDYVIKADDKLYKVLLASITYYKAEAGDEVTIIIPEGKESTWAAIENVIKKGESEGDEDEDEDSGDDLEDI